MQYDECISLYLIFNCFCSEQEDDEYAGKDGVPGGVWDCVGIEPSTRMLWTSKWSWSSSPRHQPVSSWIRETHDLHRQAEVMFM